MTTYPQQGGISTSVGTEIISLQAASLRFDIKTTTAPAAIGGDNH